MRSMVGKITEYRKFGFYDVGCASGPVNDELQPKVSYFQAYEPAVIKSHKNAPFVATAILQRSLHIGGELKAMRCTLFSVILRNRVYPL